MCRSNSSRHRSAVICVIMALAIGFAFPLAAAPEEIVGTPTIVTGDTLDVRGDCIRLYGVDAPELGQACVMHGKTYDCGHVAATALMDLTAGLRVRCVAKQRTGDVLIATCYADGYDLSEGMAYTGWALAHPDEGRRYKGLEADAKKERRGLWRGAFVAPWDWRQGRRLAGSN